MPPRHIIVIGASAGGVEAVSELVSRIPADIPAAISVTLHFPPRGASALPRILERVGSLPAAHAADGMPLKDGRIYVAPPDHHLLIFRDGIRLYRGPRENGNRPAIDPMFRSAALAYGRRVIGVVLSGSLDDGTSGLLAIKRRGGIAVAQAPEDAVFPSMPLSAIEHVDVDHVVSVHQMGELLAQLANRPVAAEERTVSDETRKELELTEMSLSRMAAETHPGVLAPFGCPDCGGTLWQLRDGDLVRFRCRVGHAWSAEALLQRQHETLDDALWTALRALEENASLNRELADRVRTRGQARLSRRFEDNAQVAERRAALIRDVLLENRDPALERGAAKIAVEARVDESERVHQDETSAHGD